MKAAEEMKREQKEVKLRMILQDYHRRNNYELQQAVNDILALDALPPAEGAKKVQWSGYGELGNISQKPLQPTAEGAEEILDKHSRYHPVTNLVYREDVLSAMNEFATLHAQKIADKMVEEMRQKLFSMRASKETMDMLSEADRLITYGYHDCINEMLMWTKGIEK